MVPGIFILLTNQGPYTGGDFIVEFFIVSSAFRWSYAPEISSETIPTFFSQSRSNTFPVCQMKSTYEISSNTPV